MKTSKLVDSLDISLKKYNFAKVSIKKKSPSKVVIDSDNVKFSFNRKKNFQLISLSLLEK